MKLIEKLTCSFFEAKKQGAIYINNDELFLFNQKVEGKFCNFSSDDLNVYTFNLLTNCTEFISLSTKSIVFCTENFLGIRTDIDKCNDKKFLLAQTECENEEYWVLLDKNFHIVEKNLTTVDNCYLIRLTADKILTKKESIIDLKYFNNSIIWRKDINQLLDSKDVTQTGEIISYKDKLFIYLYDNEDKRATIALDVETGNELFRTSEFMGYIRLQEDRIYALYGKTVSILNPESYQIRRIDLSEELAVLDESIEEFLGAESLGYTTIEFKLSPTIYEVRYPYLYFAQERGAQVGVLNLETEKLEWHATMDIDYPVNPVVMDIKACENRLYVHCADKTLHIFEME